MEATLNFVTKLTNDIRQHMEETRECIGKEIVDSTATRNGIIVDRIKTIYGVKFSLLGLNYGANDMKQIESLGNDVLVCQGNNGKFFVSAEDIVSIGETITLVRSELAQPEIGDMSKKREETFKRYFRTKERLKELLPGVEEKVTKNRKKKPFVRLFH